MIALQMAKPVDFSEKPSHTAYPKPLAPHDSVLDCSELAPLTINDPIYGQQTIFEHSLLAIIASPAIQRLKEVTQHGISAVLKMTCKGDPVTRYDHSIGAMLCVRVCGNGSVEAQAAALLHDVAHTSLSHVADSVFGYVIHEDDKIYFLREVINFLPLLEQHFSQDVLEEERYPLLEQDPPALCADRCDYGLRDAVSFSLLSPSQASTIAKSFIVYDNRFIMDSLSQARTFSDAYMKADQLAWSNETHGVLYQLAAKTIQLALKKGLLKKEGMWALGDTEFWRQFVESEDEEVRKMASRVRSDLVVNRVDDATPLGGEFEDKDGLVLEMRSKTRTLDPDVMVDGIVKRLTEWDEEYRVIREAYLGSKSGARRYRVQLPTA